MINIFLESNIFSLSVYLNKTLYVCEKLAR